MATSTLAVPRLASLRGMRLRSRTWIDALIGALAVFMVTGPAVLTRNGFMVDFTNHLWFVSLQAHAIGAHGAPTYFVNTRATGVFYPLFLFYGGTLYAAVGAVGALLGNVAGVYVAAIVAAAAAAYFGSLWLARQLGVRTLMAHAPALAFATSAIYISNLYGYGGWSEFVASSMLPLLLASGWSIARSERIGIGSASAFVVSAVLFAGSHNITLLLGAAWLAILLLTLKLTLGRSFGAVSWRRTAQIGGLLALAVAVDAWFLLPDARYGADTQIANFGTRSWHFTRFFNTFSNIFDPFRAAPPDQPLHALFVHAPVWFLGWALIVVIVLWLRAPVRLRAVAVGLVAGIGLILWPVLSSGVWAALPLSSVVQYPHRLHTFIALDAAGLVLAAVLMIENGVLSLVRGALAGLLAIAAAMSIGLCLWQLWTPDTYGVFTGAHSYLNRDQALTPVHRPPHSFFADTDYADASVHVVHTGPRFLIVNPARVDANAISLVVDPPAGRRPFTTNIAAGPYAARVGGGIVAVGRSTAGYVVARRAGRRLRGRVRITIAVASGTVGTGRAISLLAIAALFALALATLIHRRLWPA
jgi:hypothetical protein